MGPHHSFDDFEQCCLETPKNVIIHDPAKVDARTHFGLKTDDDIKHFVAQKGLTDRAFIKRDPFGAAQDLRGETMWVDVYDFWSGDKFGYFALVRNPRNGAWLIKSFTLNDKRNPREPRSSIGSITSTAFLPHKRRDKT